MIANEQLIAYVSGTLAAQERERLEEQLAGDEAALRSVVEQERLDAALRAMFGGAAEREQVKRAILEVVSGTSYQEIKSSVMHDIVAPCFSFRDWLAGWRGVLAGGLAAAACAALAFLLWPRPETVSPIQFARLSSVRNAVVVVRDDGEFAAKDGAVLQPGDAVRVGDGAATVVLADKTRLMLAERTELKLGGDATRELQLLAGRLTASVAKQPADRPLTIRTPLAVARVVGTEFTLNAAPRATRIEVSEGLVKIAHVGVDSAVEVAGGEFALAVPGNELVAGLLPPKEQHATAGDGDFVTRPFSSDSPWNTAIGSGAAYADVQSPALDLAGHGGSVRPASHFRPVFVAKPGDPPTRLVARYEDREFASVPVPTDALGDGRERPGCTVIDPARGVAYELTNAKRRGGDIEAMLCVPVNLRGPGIGGNLFSGLPMMAGVIRAGELEQGIRHALCVSVLHAGLNRRGPDGGPFVWPGRHMPIEEKKLAAMGESGNIFYGTRLALPRDLDLKTLGVGDSGPAFEIARALQIYGAYVTHSIPTAPARDGWKQPHAQFLAELPMETDWQKLDAEVSKVVRSLKIVTGK
ncbi:MAG: FecR domain-containing protein [Verrucomicrobia bacterium]|nr:FecR domain-containing protein [Verrucomicrobiota bacterium]